MNTEKSQTLSTAGGFKSQLVEIRSPVLLTNEHKPNPTKPITTEEKESSHSHFENQKQGIKLNVIRTCFSLSYIIKQNR